MKNIAAVVLGSLALVAVAGCAPTTSTTTTTAADVAAPAPREANIRDMRADPTTHYLDVTPESSSTHFAAPPSGDLVCHITTAETGTAELYLTWSKTTASGTLRRITPSGNLTDQKIHAERVHGAIVADDVASSDLVVHAATVKEHKGKKYVRLGELKSGWIACQ